MAIEVIQAAMTGEVRAPTFLSEGVGKVLRLTNRGNLIVAQSESPGQELSRLNRRFHFSPGVLSGAVAPVQEMPTTASMYTLQNNYSADSKIHLVVDFVAAFLFSGTAAVGGAVLIACVPTTVHASVLANSAGVVGPKSCAGSTNRSSLANWATGATLAAGGAWVPIGSGPSIPATNVFPCPAVAADLTNFPFIVKPGGFAAGFHVLAGAGTSAEYSMGIIYHEEEMELGT